MSTVEWVAVVLVLLRGPAPGGAAATALPPEAQTASPRALGPATTQPADEGWLGVLVPRWSSVLCAPRDGVLASVDATLGQRARSGDVLARLETAPLELELAESRLSLHEAEGELQKSEIHLAKSRDLCDRIAAMPTAFSETERKDAEFNRQVATEEKRIADLRVERQRLEIQRLEDLIRRSQVVAPFDGAVAACFLSAGATVPHATPILRLISNDLLVRFAMPAEHSTRIGVGARVRFRGRVEAAAIEAIVEHVAPEADPALQMVIVEARVLPEVVQSGIAVTTHPAARPQPGVEGRVYLSGPANEAAPGRKPG